MADPEKLPTPLPKLQLGLLLLVQLCEPIVYTSIFPFINQQLLELGVMEDAEKLGYYSGLIESTFFVCSTWGNHFHALILMSSLVRR